MWKLLPRHMEIIEEIDKRVSFSLRILSLNAYIAAFQPVTRVSFFSLLLWCKPKKPDLESKIQSMRVLDNDPNKPVVRMANMCVVSAHTVNGVAQLHSDILKAELFADYVKIWPTKFQNKTNGITPRRWLKFCNPELSNIITKYLKTDQWVSNLDLLVDLRRVSLD